MKNKTPTPPPPPKEERELCHSCIEVHKPSEPCVRGRRTNWYLTP